MAPRFGPLSLVRGCGRTGATFVGSGFGGWAATHSAEPYLLSSVCHWPSASTMTSSTVSGVESRMLLKYLRGCQSVYAGEKRESVDLPIKYQLFWFQHLLTDRAEPSRRLFHHAVPRRCIKALGMDAFLRPGREADAGIAQLFVEGMRLHPSKGMSRTYWTFQ